MKPHEFRPTPQEWGDPKRCFSPTGSTFFFAGRKVPLVCGQVESDSIHKGVDMEGVLKVRKLPVEVEAVLWDGSDLAVNLLQAWAGKAVQADQSSGRVWVKTEEGTMGASLGDYIIKGVKGEFYPCKPAVFEQTYQIIR